MYGEHNLTFAVKQLENAAKPDVVRV